MKIKLGKKKTKRNNADPVFAEIPDFENVSR